MNNRIFSFLKYFIGAFYVFIGITLMVNQKPLEAYMQPLHVKILGGLIIVYGVFRLYRTYRLERQKQ